MKVALFALMTEKQSNATLSLFDDFPENDDKLDHQAAAARMRALEKDLERWNYEYYVLDAGQKVRKDAKPFIIVPS